MTTLLSMDDWRNFNRRVRQDLIPHLFISYAHEDRAFAEQLARDLRERGLQVWLDLWEMRVGDSIIQKINQGIEESGYLVVVLSPDSVRSRWMQEELSAGLKQQLDGQDVRVLPVLLRDCEIPPLLCHRFYADFRSDYEHGLSQLLKTIEPLIAVSSKDQTSVTVDRDVVPGEDEQRTQISQDWVAMKRLQQLADNLRNDLALLKEYEDALRYEDDPRRRARYRRDIEQLRGSLARHQREYDELQGQVADEWLGGMDDVANQLQQMKSSLDTLQLGQTRIRDDLEALRQTLLARYETSEHAIVAGIAEQLNQVQLSIVGAVVDALEAGRIPDAEIHQVLDVAQEMLAVLHQRGITLPGQHEVAEAIAAPTLGAKHKLKITLPIIPLLLGYEGEVELASGVDLETMWKQLMAKLSSDGTKNES